MMQTEAIWNLSKKMPCYSAIKYLARGTKCIQSDIPTKLQILQSNTFKNIPKYNTTHEQKNETYFILVPHGKNKYLFSSLKNNSTYGITPSVLCNLRASPMGKLQELLSCLSSAEMFQISKDAGLIKSVMSFPSMQQMCIHLNAYKTNISGQPKSKLKIHFPICGISDKQGQIRNIYGTETSQGKKSDFCPPKKSKGEENNDTCESGEAAVKTGAKGVSKKECLNPKNQSPTFCAKAEEKNDLCSSSKGQMKAPAPSQESHCGQDDFKQECLVPKTQAIQTFCTKPENKNDPKLQMKASAASNLSYSAKADSKKECITPKQQATQTFCESKKDCKAKASATQVNCTSEPSANAKPQMKAAGCPGPQGAQGSKDNKPPKKEKEGCEAKSQAKPQETKCEKKEAKKDPCPTKPQPQPQPPAKEAKEAKVCETKPPGDKPCPRIPEEKKRVGCEPPPQEAKKCPPPTPDKKLKGSVPYPCPKMSTKKKDAGTPAWQCGLIAAIVALIVSCICYLALGGQKKEEEPQLDAKGRPIKK